MENSGSETLEAAIARRKKEAERRDIGLKAMLIATSLGESRSASSDRRVSGRRYTYENVRVHLRITHSSGVISSSDGDTAFFGTEVFFLGKLVYQEGGGDVLGYIPGKWERILNRLQPEVEKQEKRAAQEAARKASAAKAQRERDERYRWGL